MDRVLTFSEEHQAWIVVPSHSLIGVFIKSLHLLALAWMLTVLYIWLALDAGARSIVDAVLPAALPAALIEGAAWGLDRWLRSWGRLAYARMRARGRMREWQRAISWTSVPMGFLAFGAFLVTG